MNFIVSVEVAADVVLDTVFSTVLLFCVFAWLIAGGASSRVKKTGVLLDVGSADAIFRSPNSPSCSPPVSSAFEVVEEGGVVVAFAAGVFWFVFSSNASIFGAAILR